MYGPNWATMVDDVSDAFFTNYVIGSPIEAAVDYDKDALMSNAVDINTDKGL